MNKTDNKTLEEFPKIMNSYRTSYYHIVICTYCRRNTLPEEQHEALYRFIWGVVKNRKSVLIRINGTENHIHILCDMHPTIALSDFVKEIKLASNKWIKESGKFPKFESWSEGYCGLSYSQREKEMLINYIKNQKEHHKKTSFEEEYRVLLKEHNIDFEEKYLFVD